MTDNEQMLNKLTNEARAMVQFAPEALARALQATASDREVSLRATLEAMRAGDGQQSALFFDLCEYVAEVFPDAKTTDAQFLASAATPDLMRYLIAALKKIREGSQLNGGKRKSATFESAFLYRRPSSGKNSGVVEHYEDICSAGRRAKLESAQTGADEKSQILAAVRAGYQKFRELTEPSDGTSRGAQNGSDHKTSEIHVIEAFKREGIFEDDVLDREVERRQVKG